MISKEEKEIKKKTENKEKKINHENDFLIKQKLIEFLSTQLKESEEQILEKELKIEREIISIYNRLNNEIEKSKKFSLEKNIIDFLPIFDSIERALNIIEKNKPNDIYNEIINKLNLTHDLVQETFSLFNIKKIDDTNIPFNPSIHQAMSIYYTDELEPNKIITVMQSGYILHESRLLRPAMVVVSKKKT